MQFFLSGLIPFLDSPQGSALYSLLVLIGLAAVFMRLKRRGKMTRTTQLGLAALIGLRLSALVMFAQSWLGDTDGLRLLAPLERSIHLISIVIFAWMWTGKGRDLFLSSLLGGAILLGSIFILLGPAIPSFNYSVLDYAWSVACLSVLILAAIRIRPSVISASAGTAQLGLLALGQILHTFLAEPFGSMPLFVEGFALGALPLLSRLQVLEPDGMIEAARSENREAYEVPDFLDFHDLAANGQTAEAGLASQPLEPDLAKDIAVRFSADICLLVTLNEVQNQLHTDQGFNTSLASPATLPALPARKLPRITSSLEKARPLRLAAEEHVPELTVLSEGLGLPSAGHLLAVPFSHPGDLPRRGVLLINLEKEWTLENEVALEFMAADLSSRLSGLNGGEVSVFRKPEAVKTIDESLEDAELLRAENRRLREELQRLSDYIQSLQTASAGGSIGTMVETLRRENKQLKSALDSLMQGHLEPDVAKEELRLALEELATHQARLDVAQNALVDAKLHEVAGNISIEQVELIASIAQELRQPLSSIWGYTDLLLGESVGILGALQQKFLERVRNSTDRMNSLIEDLIRIVELEHTMNNLYGKAVNLNQLIDEGVHQIQSQVKEKELDLRIDITADLPELNTDRDAVQQIVYHLLQNAYDATPPQGSISVQAFRERQPELGEYVLIRIKDSGGGIPEEHISRVFSRIYRSTNPVIEGVGDTGVGLSIAEVLTRALGGRIWVESDLGVGSAFNVLLPVRPDEDKSGNT